jgi:hypothetical protein
VLHPVWGAVRFDGLAHCQSVVFTNKDESELPKHEWCKAQGTPNSGCSVHQFRRDVTGWVRLGYVKLA